jgi:hypothetical protein
VVRRRKLLKLLLIKVTKRNRIKVENSWLSLMGNFLLLDGGTTSWIGISHTDHQAECMPSSKLQLFSSCIWWSPSLSFSHWRVIKFFLLVEIKKFSDLIIEQPLHYSLCNKLSIINPRKKRSARVWDNNEFVHWFCIFRTTLTVIIRTDNFWHNSLIRHEPNIKLKG